MREGLFSLTVLEFPVHNRLVSLLWEKYHIAVEVSGRKKQLTSWPKRKREEKERTEASPFPSEELFSDLERTLPLV
jgi:hypothetical protein